ncbi:MAG: hypothetical protein ILP18_06290, partial [Treponema sp.]|nr:hypothetical protein [Treponema sp.]
MEVIIDNRIPPALLENLKVSVYRCLSRSLISLKLQFFLTVFSEFFNIGISIFDGGLNHPEPSKLVLVQLPMRQQQFFLFHNDSI